MKRASHKRTLASLIIVSGITLALCACETDPTVDYVIKNGQVFTGDNQPAQPLMLALKDELIVYVGAPKKFKTDVTIDATDFYVLPGFIDPHTHSLSELTSVDPIKRSNENYLRQGVTTVFNGNDGYGAPTISEQINAFNAQGIGTNTALFIGHGALRQTVMGGEKRAPTADELNTMKQSIRDGMDAGALGLSTGLFYAPGSFSDTQEVIALSKIVASKGGVYDSHIRDESTYNIGLDAAIDEVIEIAAEANIPANIAHIKALGVDVWGKSEPLIEKIEAAQARGLKITADQYPWRASGTRISNALLPRWVKAGSAQDYQNRLIDPALSDRIKKETAENLRKRGGPDAVLITQEKQDWQNKTLGELATLYALSPVDMAIKIAREGDARIASFNMSPDDIEAFMVQEWVMTSSDGSTGHPRKYASYPKKYQDYIIAKSLMPVETFFYKSSGLVADTFNLCKRGYLKQGYKADIAIINPDTFKPIADFRNPQELTTGIEHLFVNGTLVIASGDLTPALAGRAVKRCEASQRSVNQNSQ